MLRVSYSLGKERLLAFDYLRALAVLVLLFHHGGIYNVSLGGVTLLPLQSYGTLFINGTFLFISGYFALISLQNRENNLLAFYRSKFVRIYPPYFLALFLFVYWLGFFLRKRDYFIYMFCLQTIFSPLIAKPILTIWFIGVLFLFYFLFGVVVHFIHRDILRLVGALVFFIAAYILHVLTGLIDERFFLYYFMFLMGVICAKSERLTALILSSRNLFSKFVFAVVGFLTFGFVHGSGFVAVSAAYIAAADLFILSLDLFLLSCFSRIAPLSYPLTNNIARTSLFAYLYHRPIWKMLHRLVGTNSVAQETLVNLLPGSLLTIVVSYYLQREYDKFISRARWS